MQTYDFISNKITLNQVKQIITRSGYNANDYAYAPRVDNDGFVVSGSGVMSTTTLRNTAGKLNITVEIDSGPVAGRGNARLADPGSPYSVVITMSPDTVNALLGGKYSLYGFKAVATSGAGVPLVWFQTQGFSTTTTVQWTEEYAAYTSTQQIIPNGVITAGDQETILLGQQMNVGQGGVGTVVDGTVPGAIAINNTTTTQFTCGIAQTQNGVTSPLCAFPLYGNGEDVIVPIEKVLLTFSTKPVNTGTVIEQAYSQGLLIDLTGVTTRSVSFDINLGWTWGGYAWGSTVPASANLVPLLIEDSATLRERRLQ